MHGAVGQTLMIESGEVLEFDEFGARKAGKVPVGRVCIDSGAMGDVIEDVVIKDRRHLSEDGIVLPIVAINKLTGRVESTEIVTRGFASATVESELTSQARDIVSTTIEGSSAEEVADYGVMKEKIRADLKRFIVKSTDRRPLILPVILEI
jgi:ribonuclease J